MSAITAVDDEAPMGTTTTAEGESEHRQQEKRPPVCLVLGMAGSGKTTLVDALASFAESISYCTKELNSLNLDADNGQAGHESTGNTESSSGERVEQNVSVGLQKGELSKRSGRTGEEAEKGNSDDSNSAENKDGKHAGTATQTGGGGGDDVDDQSEEGDDAEAENQVFVINIDPAVHETPYQPNVDIRDVIKFQGVMREYGLGPNGAIMTSLNLYATRFDQVLEIIERRRKEVSLFVVDTPGQIETFTWSASGMIITDALAMTLPTVALFVVDTSRANAPMTFVSNMLYACSILYKTRLPLVVVFNKTDVADAEKLNQWMRDFDEFDNALSDERFVGNLARSLAMALDEFYNAIPTVSVSAQTGAGMPELLDAIHTAAARYDKEYRPILESRMRARALEKTQKMEQDLERFRKDAADDPSRRVSDNKDQGNAMAENRPLAKDSIRLSGTNLQGQSSVNGSEGEVDEEERKAYEDLKRVLQR